MKKSGKHKCKTGLVSKTPNWKRKVRKKKINRGFDEITQCLWMLKYHIQLKQDKNEEQNSKTVVQEKWELKHQPGEDSAKRCDEYNEALPKNP